MAVSSVWEFALARTEPTNSRLLGIPATTQPWSCSRKSKQRLRTDEPENLFRRSIDDAVDGSQQRRQVLVEVADDDGGRRQDGHVVGQVVAGVVPGVG